MKLYLGQQMDMWLDDDDNLENWENNSLTASDRRILGNPSRDLVQEGRDEGARSRATPSGSTSSTPARC